MKIAKLTISWTVILIWIPFFLVYLTVFLFTAILGVGLPTNIFVGFGLVTITAMFAPLYFVQVKAILGVFVIAGLFQSGMDAIPLSLIIFSPWAAVGIIGYSGYDIEISLEDGVRIIRQEKAQNKITFKKR